MAGPSSSSNYLTGADDLLKDDPPLSVAKEEALKNKSGVEVNRITGPTSDETGKRQKALLEEEEVKNQPPTSDKEGAPANGKDTPYYIYGESSSATTYPVSFAQNLFGANTDVVGPLAGIKFESSFDGSLQNAIAYIVPWKRTGFNSRTPANPTTSDTPASQNLSFLGDDLGIDLKFESIPDISGLYENIDTENLFTGELDTNFLDSEVTIPEWNVDTGEWYEGPSAYQIDTQKYLPTTDVKGNKPTAQGQEAAGEKQKALGSEIPLGLKQGILAGTSFLAGSLLQDNPRLSSIAGTGINQIAGKVFNVPTGPIYVGNENGIINQVVSGASSLGALFGVNIPRGLTTTVKPDRQPNTPKNVNLKAAPKRTDGAWQFLFNPSELGLTASPEYSKSETWGVMDAKEAGSPLQFNRMKNPQLKFNNIKLNGYVFGKQVEDLEQGIFKLMMTAGGADNGALAGPQVLEFVWGKKTFGPCVIKDISITEKMWDNGLLVNADLNFILEKIPEWTVNDGQVSVYAPGTQGTQTAPEEQNNEEPDESEKPEPPEPPEPVNKIDYQKCGVLKIGLDNIPQLIRNGDYYKKRVLDFGKAEFFGSSFFGEPGMDPDIGISKMSSQYVNWSSRTNVGGMIPAGTSACGISSLNKEKEKINGLPDYVGAGASRAQNSKKMRDAVALIGKYQKCIKEREAILKKIRQEECKFSSGGGNAGGAQSIDPNAPAYIPPYSQQNQ